MRRTLSLFLFIAVSHLHAQEVTKLAGLVALSSTGEFVISTRKAPGAAANAQPEVYEVITGKDGGATLTLGAVGAVKMEQGTQIRLPAAGAPQSLEVMKGKLFFDINAAELKKNQNSEFRLKTPTALLAVKGTQFFVESSAGKETVGVHEGSAAIATLAARSTGLLQKGQASTHGQGQPVSPRPMQPEELALGTTYAAVLPVKQPALALVVSGSSGMAEYLVKGDTSTVSKDDAGEISKLGPTVMILPESPDDSRLELAKTGIVGVFPTQARGGPAVLRFKLVVRQSAAALRFYLRSSPDYTVAVEGRLVTPGRAGQLQTQPWSDCLLDLRTPPGAEHSFTLELTRTAAKSSAKPKAAILELADFTCLSPPAAP